MHGVCALTLAQEMNPFLEHFDTLLPIAARWAEDQERLILSQGLPLSEQGLIDAKLMGVQMPERIRLLRVSSIPVPTDPILESAATATGLISPMTGGMALRYGIFIRSDCWLNREMVAHECVHTAQYERFGSVEAFLRQYLHECFDVGYPLGPLEQEAIINSSKIKS